MRHSAAHNLDVSRKCVAFVLGLAISTTFWAVPRANAQGAAKANCRTLLSAKEVGKIMELAKVEGPEQLSGDNPGSPIAKGVTTCTYGAPGWMVQLSVYGGPSVQSPFGTIWKNQKGTPLSGIGEGAYFDASALKNGVARAKGVGLTVQFLAGFMTKNPPPAVMRSWTEQILKLVVERL